MASITVFVADDEGNGLPNQDVALRRKGLSDFGADAYQMVDVAGEPGAYKYSGHVTDTYKVWVNGEEDKGYGGDDGVDVIRITDVLLKSGGTMTGDVSMDGNRINDLPDSPISDNEASPAGWVTETLMAALAAYFKKDGSVAMTADMDMGSNKITELADAAADDEALSLGLAKSTFPEKGALAVPQSIYAKWTFFKNPFILENVFGPFNATTVKWVKDYVALFLAGTLAPYQQTETLIIVDFNCAQEDNRRYATISGAMAVANDFSDPTRRMIIWIQGSGNDDTSLIANYNRLGNDAEDYVDIVCMEQSVEILTQDLTYAATAIGKNIISGGTIKNLAGGSTVFNKYVFRNVKFKNADGTGGFTFTDCIFENCTRETCSIATTTCKGQILDLTNSQLILLDKVVEKTGTYDVVLANGDIRGRRVLGRYHGSGIASASDMTLGNGNYFLITGTTTINFIQNVDWEAGSIIILEFGASGGTVKHGQIPAGTQAGIENTSGADYTTVNGAFKKYFLNRAKTYWIEL